jgi:autotransporter-associated beta strand protein
MKLKLVIGATTAIFAATAVWAWDNPLSVEAGATYTLSDDETHDQLIVGEGSIIDLSGHNLTITGAFSPNSSDSNRAIIKNTASGDAAKMIFTLTQGIGSSEFTKVQFDGNLALEVSVGFSSANFMNGVSNTHTGGTTLKNITGNQNPRINTADALGLGAVVFDENSNLRDINGSAYTYSWKTLASKGAGVNYFYMERNHSIGAIPVTVEAGNTFALSDLRNGIGDWNSADYSGVVGTFWVNGNGSGNISFTPDMPNGVLMLSKKEIRNGLHISGDYVWKIGAIASPDSVTADDESAVFRRVDGTGGKVTVEVGSANVDTTWYGRFVYDGNNDKDWNIKKVGTGTWTIGGVNYYHGTTEIADGAIVILAGGELGDSGTAPDINLTGGALLLGTGVTHNPLARVKTPNAGVPAKLGSPAGNSYTVEHSLSGITQGITKVGEGTLTLTSTAMDFTGAVAVEGGTLVMPEGCAFSATVDESAVLVVGETEICSSYGHYGDISVVVDANGTITATQAVDPDFSACTWTGKGGDNYWTTRGNWSNDTVPGAGDDVLIDGDAEIEWASISENKPSIGMLYVNGTLTISMPASTDKYDRGLHLKGIKGSSAAKLVMNGARLSTVSGVTATNEIAIVTSKDTDENWLTGLGNAFWRQNGPISGDGTVRFRGWSGTAGVRIAGDNSQFTGKGIFDEDSSNCSCFVTPEAGSASAQWFDMAAKQTNRIYFDDKSCGGTIWLGSITQSVYKSVGFRVNLNNWDSVTTFKIGGNGVDSLVMGQFGDAPNSGNWQRPSANCRVQKVGDETLQVYRPSVRNGWLLDGGVVEAIGPDALEGYLQDKAVSPISFNGGTLRYGYDSTSETKGPVTTDWSEYVRNSKAAIKVETTGADVTWATALGDSNETHEIVKTGKGRLILTAAPSWGTTKVTVGFNSKGAVLLPASAPYELGLDEAHSTRVSSKIIDGVAYNEFTNPQSFVIILR